ncbi:hypothetical protein FHETE_9990 [Fusarium heterosporum]|uniref:Uncharacterized protein n=1 Tax=Fusarium heterosporum TaxID=42747 RepID=A0A8H5SWA9_FUSHE|nr:hypothetical protein FHETE_9990 [Fusarium heterosporum]
MAQDQQRSDSPTLPIQCSPLPLSKSIISPVENLADNADIPNITPIGSPVISYGSTPPIPIKTEGSHQRRTTVPDYFTPPNTTFHDFEALPADDGVFDMTDLIDETNPEDTIQHISAQHEYLDGYGSLLAQEIPDCLLQISDSDFSLITEEVMEGQIQQPID